MDVVILAGGRNERLRGIVPPFMKPLLVVNGQCLLVNAARLACEAAGRTNRVIVVTAPQNTLQISEVLQDAGLADSVDLVVQPAPRGPGDALLRAFKMVGTKNTLILLGDNSLSRQDVETIYLQGDSTVDERLVAGCQLRLDGGEFFTRFCENGDIIEGTPGGRWADGYYRIWVGPLVVPTNTMEDLLRSIDPGSEELKIGKFLGRLNLIPSLVQVSSEDVGTPQWLIQAERPTLDIKKVVLNGHGIPA